MDETTADRIGRLLRLALEGGALVLLGVVIWRVGTLELNVVEFRFADLLAMVLALFAIGLAAAFYFRTTETSNRFYDSTFRFTKDISETLGRIEERFGERLRHIDESYSGLSDKLSAAEQTAQGAAEEVEEEREELKRIAAEKDELIEELLEQAHVTDTERERIRKRLAAQEKRLEEAHMELREMESRFQEAESRAAALRQRLARQQDPEGIGPRDRRRRFHRWFPGWVRGQSDLLPDEASLADCMASLEEAFEAVGHEPKRDAARLGFYDPGSGWTAMGREFVAETLAEVRR